MPNENPTPRSCFAEIETVFLTLHFYGAAGIAAFGWSMGSLLGIDASAHLPLWLCAALLIYNADRLRRDPADALNVPARSAASARLRRLSAGTLLAAAVVLLGIPVWRRDWFTLGLILLGGVVSLGYSLPPVGWRWKDLPLIKTLFAPSIVTAAVFGLLVLGQTRYRPEGLGANPMADTFSLLWQVTFLLPWAWCYLLFNMVLCDLRDLAGDRQCGIHSIPVLWGEKGARRLLWVLAIGGQVIPLALLRFCPDEGVPLSFVALLTGLYQAWLLHATREPRSERFYEWAVEGLLYLPALALIAAGWVFHFMPDDV